MGATYFFLPEASLLVTGYWGRVDVAASQRVRRARAGDPGISRARAHVIDLSLLEGTTTSTRVEGDTFRALASVYVQTFGPLRTAIVAGPTHVFGLARIFETVAGLQDPPVPVRVVRTWADAAAFLGLDLAAAQAELERRRASVARGAALRLTYVGGPTALLELGGLRFLTDPTFDPGGSEYPTREYVLRKTQGPALAPDAIGTVDFVLLSHDHHFDNLDRAGRQMLTRAGHVLTTAAGAERLGGNAIGLTAWQTHDISTLDGRVLRITATPTRHGPPGGDRGPVNGFVLAWADEPAGVVYVSGDTVWFDGVAEVARRFSPGVAVLFAGAARVPEVGPAHLTFTADEAVTVARVLPGALVVPLHFEGWAHFSESRADLERAFSAAALAARLRLPIAGHPLDL